MKLIYHIEFAEKINDVSDIESGELARIKKELEKRLYQYLTYCGLEIVDGIKLDFDLEED